MSSGEDSVVLSQLLDRSSSKQSESNHTGTREKKESSKSRSGKNGIDLPKPPSLGGGVGPTKRHSSKSGLRSLGGGLSFQDRVRDGTLIEGKKCSLEDQQEINASAESRSGR